MSFLTGQATGIVIGLLLGWLLIPEPAFIRDWWSRITSRLIKPTQP